MRQIYQQQLFPAEEDVTKGESRNSSVRTDQQEKRIRGPQVSDFGSKDEIEHEDSSLAAASMWTRKDIKEFKEAVRTEGGEAIIKVGQGESVTVSFLKFKRLR